MHRCLRTVCFIHTRTNERCIYRYRRKIQECAYAIFYIRGIIAHTTGTLTKMEIELEEERQWQCAHWHGNSPPESLIRHRRPSSVVRCRESRALTQLKRIIKCERDTVFVHVTATPKRNCKWPQATTQFDASDRKWTNARLRHSRWPVRAILYTSLTPYTCQPIAAAILYECD